MIEVAVCALTGLPIAWAAARGWGGSDAVLRRIWILTSAWLAAGATAWFALALGWFWPFGLVTPLVIGVAVGGLVGQLARTPASMAVDVSATRRCAGLLAGGACGTVAVAAGWLTLLAVTGVSLRTPVADARAERSAWSACLKAAVRTAHDGFLAHLPLIGPLATEMDALLVVLESDPAARRRLCGEQCWNHLATLPEMRAALDDRAILEDIEAVRSGSLLALYRLQRHPAIVALAESKEIRKIAAELRPSVLAQRLRTPPPPAGRDPMIVR